MKLLSQVIQGNFHTETVDPLTDPNKLYYSPGVVGFIAVFLLMLAATLLILDMVRRVRRVRYRGEIQAKLASEATGKRAKTDK